MASLKHALERLARVILEAGDPRLNAVASLKQLPRGDSGGWRVRDPRLNAVASLKLDHRLLVRPLCGVIHGLMPWPH